MAPTAAPDLQLGFLGAGKMATALARGVVASGFVSREAVIASDSAPASRAAFQQQTGCRCVESNASVVEAANVLIIAVKPQQMAGLLAELAPCVAPRHLVISLAAGCTIAAMSQALGKTTRIARVMSNTPALVGSGASAFALGEAATPDDARVVTALLASVGWACELPERLLDAVTGLSGSGPAYACTVIEALADGGVRMGLPRDVAQKLAAQTLLGTARMILETGEHPAALKDAVASPGGTTMAGLHALECRGLRGALIEAVVAATNRSKELAGG